MMSRVRLAAVAAIVIVWAGAFAPAPAPAPGFLEVDSTARAADMLLEDEAVCRGLEDDECLELIMPALDALQALSQRWPKGAR